jgi:hypothetical protein
LINLIAFVIKDYFEQNSVEEDYEKADEFAEFILKGILNKTEEHLKNRPLLSDKSF